MFKTGILSKSEVERLRRYGSAAIVLVSWVVKRSQKHKDLIGCPQSKTIQDCVTELRTSAAYQALWTKTQIPFVHFSTVYFIVHVFLLFSSASATTDFVMAYYYSCRSIKFHSSAASYVLHSNRNATEHALRIGEMSGHCTPRMVFVVVAQIFLICVFLMLMLAASKVSQSYESHEENTGE